MGCPVKFSVPRQRTFVVVCSSESLCFFWSVTLKLFGTSAGGALGGVGFGYKEENTIWYGSGEGLDVGMFTCCWSC